MYIENAIIERNGEISRDIIECLANLYATKVGTQPLDREFGISAEYVGQPMDVFENEYALEVIEKTERYESRVKVADVTFEVDVNQGKIVPVIKITQIQEEEEGEE